MCLKPGRNRSWHWLPLWRTPSVSGISTSVREYGKMLIGYGWWSADAMGLPYSPRRAITTQTLNNNMLSQSDYGPTGTNMQLKNVGGVMVTASYPPFCATGQTTMSSFLNGNAKSLRGGTLLMTPLCGMSACMPAGQYSGLAARALSAGGRSAQVNHSLMVAHH